MKNNEKLKVYLQRKKNNKRTDARMNVSSKGFVSTNWQYTNRL